MVITVDNRLSVLEYALLSDFVYLDLRKGAESPEKELAGWRVHAVHTGANDYFGAIFKNTKTRHVVVAHRGTNSLSSVWEDIRGVVLNGVSPQKEEAFILTQIAIEYAREEEYSLSFTGHSLGAFLADLSVLFAHNAGLTAVSATTFENPGSRDAWKKLMSQTQPLSDADLNGLDIQSYMGYPNLIDTCSAKVGSVYQLGPDLGVAGWLPGVFLKQCHSMLKAIKYLRSAESAPLYFSDWPLGSQRDEFFDQAKWNDGRYVLNGKALADTSEEELRANFKLTYSGHYRNHPVFDSKTTVPLQHFGFELANFLKEFFEKILGTAETETEKARLATKLRETGVPENIQKYLSNYKLVAIAATRIVILVLTNADAEATIHDFRAQLSKWLSERPEAVKKLLSITTGKLPINVSLVTGDGRVENVLFKGPLHLEGYAVDDGVSSQFVDEVTKTAQNRLESISVTLVGGKGVVSGVTFEQGAHLSGLKISSVRAAASPSLQPQPSPDSSSAPSQITVTGGVGATLGASMASAMGTATGKQPADERSALSTNEQAETLPKVDAEKELEGFFPPRTQGM